MMIRLPLSGVWRPMLLVAVLAFNPSLATIAGDEGETLKLEVDQLVRDLNADQFVVRKVAALELDRLASRAEPKALAEELQRVLLQSKLSFEVRASLERIAQSLPKVKQASGTATAAEIERLIDQLESDGYAERLGASRRLDWLLSSPELACPIMVRLKARLLQQQLSPDARLWIEPLDRNARLAWLTSDPGIWQLPAISDERIATWIDDLVKPAADGSQVELVIRASARRELLDTLARDEYVPRLMRALEAKLADPRLDPAGRKRLGEILDLTLPAMVAEFWTGRQHLGTQYLVVGVPSLGPGAERPSHFDRIDDRMANCVSGNSLAPGEYPVGVAVPHPKQENAIFHLVNLPTPRRRMAYEYRRQTDAAARLAEITRCTVERYFGEKRHLTEAELLILPQLDADLASAFAAKMLMAIRDKRLPEEGPQRTAGRPSHHGMLCLFLAAEGTKSATPALLEAIEANRMLPPTDRAPYRLDWLAALSIAVADPWPEAESWLAGLIDHNDPLIQDRPDSPQLGATAAAVLLARHEEALLAFGLEPTGDRVLEIFGLHGCRFNSAEARQSVHRWWNERRRAATLGSKASP